MNVRARISEFDTPEQAASYARWLQEKIARSLADPRAAVPHDEAMARAGEILDTRRPG